MTINNKLAEVVGRDNILDSPEGMEPYSHDSILEPPGKFDYVARPKDAGETQKIVQLANETGFAIVPQSSGIHFNGDSVPKRGGVALDLSRMNHITEIDEESRVAHIEVGVNWEQLQTSLAAKGYRAMIPLLPHPRRSVISDWLKRELPVAQIHEYADPLLSLQVIWGNGEEFVTGSASINTFRDPDHPECVADGVIPDGPGPINFDEFLYGSQGTMGVVTWGIVKFEAIPTLTKTFFIPTESAEEAIEPIYNILRRRVGYECLLINNVGLAAILTRQWPDQFNELRNSLPPWMTILVIGALKRRPEERIAYQEECLNEIMSTQFPGLKLLTTLPGMADMEEKIPEMLRQPWPNDRTYWKHAYKGNCQDITFMTTLDRVEKFIPVMSEVAAKHRYPVDEIGCYIQPAENGRACQLQFNLYYDPNDEAEKGKIKQIYTEAAKATLEKGAYFTQLYGEVPDIVYGQSGDYTAILKRVKSLLDPNGILNPGHLCF